MGADASIRRPDASAALAAVGLLAAGGVAARHGLGAAHAAWRSWPLRPARVLAAPVACALTERGRSVEQAWRTAEAGVTERVVAVLVDHAVVERTVAALLRVGVLERVGAQVLDSPALDRVVERALASPELERVVGEIASSDAVRTAVSRQTRGIADDVGDQLRTRSAAADDATERLVRRLLRRGTGQSAPLESR